MSKGYWVTSYRATKDATKLARMRSFPRARSDGCRRQVHRAWRSGRGS